MIVNNHYNMIRGARGFALIQIILILLILSVLFVVAIPNFLRARETSRAESCQGNLRQIELAKEQWAIDNEGNTDGALSLADLMPKYIESELECPSGGHYTVGGLGCAPICSIGLNGPGDYDDHILPGETPPK